MSIDDRCAPVRHNRVWAVAAGVGALAVMAAIWSDLLRPGYSPDEEFTLFAVRGIEAWGLPLLPSGLLYDRGLAYSYAVWAGALVGGSPLTAGRIVSLVCSALAALVVFRHVARLGSTRSAAAAVGLVATSLPFWVSATTARFYAPFLLGYLVCLAVIGRSALGLPGLMGLALAAGLTRWTHELAFTLAAVPVVAGLVAARSERRRWALRFVAIVAGLVGGQLALFAVHAVAPPTNGDVMVRRFFLWQVLNLFERPPLDLARLRPGAVVAGALTATVLAWLRVRQDVWSGTSILIGGLASSLGQLAVGPLAALVALPIVGGSARRTVAWSSLAVLAASVTFWVLALSAAGFAPREAGARLGETGFLYPLDMLSYLVRESPWLVGTTMTGLLARAAGRGGAWTWPERALHVSWLGWVLWFGVVESGITVRYLLLPVTFMLTAVAVDAAALVRTTAGTRRAMVLLAAVVLAVAVIAESWFGPVGDERRWVDARPTFDPAALAAEIHPDDLVASTDELAGVMVARRLDAWLVLDEFFRERFVVMRGGVATGTYTGAPAASAFGPLLDRAGREQRRLVVVDVLKDMPGFGLTAGLVPRQLAREELRGEVVAETAGFRLVHVVAAREGAVVVATRDRPSLIRR